MGFLMITKMKELIKRYAVISILMITYVAIEAQYNYDAEAIKYSMYEYKGTARTAGVAGAFSTVGPDAGGINLNPAIVGTFRTSESTVSLNFMNSSSKSNYLNKNSTENKFKVSAQQFCIVFASTLGNAKKSNLVLKGIGFSLSANRIADFNNLVYFEGKNRTNSIVDQYVYFLNAYPYINLPVNYTNFPADYVLANQSKLVNYNDVFNYYSSAAGGGQPNYQTGAIKTTGGITDFSLALGFNLWDKLYIGASIDAPYLNYKRAYTYTEEDKDDSIAGFRKLEYNETYRAQGFGFNGKLGFIYKPFKLLRIGASIASPTYYNIKEQYSYSMEHTTDSSVLSVESPLGGFQYTYKQPYRFNAGASIFFDKYGFFSLDYEMVNYALNKYNFGTKYKDQAAYYNDTLIRNKYKISHQIRAGIELAYKTGRVRFGYSYQFSPFKKGIAVEGADLNRHLISAGLGYRGKRLSIDLAYVHTITRDYFAPYISVMSFPQYEDGAVTKTGRDNVMLTVGVKFK